MKTHDFYYDLPEELIAQTPVEPRDHSRMLVVHRKDGHLEHKHFYDIVDYLRPGDVLVVNDTRVIPARLIGERAGGGAAEVLLLKQLGPKKWETLVRPGRRLKPGAEVIFGGGKLVALDKETGEEVWVMETQVYSWSTPTLVYDQNGDAYVLYCTTGHYIYLLDARTGEMLDSENLGGLIEASPAVYGNWLVVGHRNGSIYGIELT